MTLSHMLLYHTRAVINLGSSLVSLVLSITLILQISIPPAPAGESYLFVHCK